MPVIKVILVVIGCSVLNAVCLYAGVAVSPVTTEIIVPADRVTGGVWAVTNTGSEPVRVKAEYGESWLAITPAEFDIEPYGVKKVEYAISPPRGCEGELSAMVFFGVDEGIASAASRPRNDVRKFGVSIFAAIKDSIELACKIDNITVKSRAKEGDILFIMDVKNTGNVHIRPEGEILIRGEDGSEYEVKIEKGFPVYPEANLNYAVRWDERDVPLGRYEAVIRLDYGNVYGEEKTVEKRVEFVME